MMGPATESDPQELSLIENDAPLRGWRLLRIVPPDGLGIVRRAVLLGLFSWLPIAIWVAATGRLSLSSIPAESFLAHYGVHVRCLIVTPCLIVAEAHLHTVGRRITGRFLSSGLITPALQPEFDRIVSGLVRLRDATLPWLIAVVIAVVWSAVDSTGKHPDVLSWAALPDGRMGFGGLWYAYVARPLLILLFLGWVWRLVLVTIWMARVGRLPLAFVASHPDRTGGIGFIENIPQAFALVTFSTAAVIAARWAHEVVHHGTSLKVFQAPAIAYVLIWSLLMLLPLLVTFPALFRARRNAVPEYAALVGQQARAIHRRWVDRRALDDPDIIEPDGVGPMADAQTLYNAVWDMRVVPIGKIALVSILVPMVIPFLVLGSLEVPIGTILLALLKAVA